MAYQLGAIRTAEVTSVAFVLTITALVAMAGLPAVSQAQDSRDDGVEAGDTPDEGPREGPDAVRSGRPAASARKILNQGCVGETYERAFRDLPGLLRGQSLLMRLAPSDLLLHCGERSVDIGAGFNTRDERIKSSGFQTKTEGRERWMEAALQGGRELWRYGVQLDHHAGQYSSKQELAALGAAGKAERTEDRSSFQADAAGRFAAFGVGLALRYTRARTSLEQPVAGETVLTKGPQLSVVQPAVSLDWRRPGGLLTVARYQAAEATKDGRTLRIPWLTSLRYVHILEQDQGVRLQFERAGGSSDNSNPHNRMLLAYFLMISDVTVDVAWSRRAASYKEAANAAADEIAAFGFAASVLWQYSPLLDVYGALHSLSGNESLGGKERRTAHTLVAGGSLGVQVSF